MRIFFVLRTKALIAFVVLLLAAPSMANSEEVWNGIRFGMSRAEVELLFPANQAKVKSKANSTEIENVPIVGKCEAEAEVFYMDEMVERVELKGKGSLGGRCADKVFAALASKYGPADGRDHVTGDGLFRRNGSVSVWTRNGLTLEFKNYGTSGLAQHSWRLVYSTVAQDVNL